MRVASRELGVASAIKMCRSVMITGMEAIVIESFLAARRYGVNMPIQGTSADILKRSLRILHDSINGTSAKLVNIVHDEIIVECDSAKVDEAKDALEKAMVGAGQHYLSNVPVKVDSRVSQAWSKV